jgi:hypothetical protein
VVTLSTRLQGHPWPLQAWQVGGKAKVCLDLRWLALQASLA